MQNTSSVEPINTSQPLFPPISAGNRHCVGGWEAGGVEEELGAEVAGERDESLSRLSEQIIFSHITQRLLFFPFL